MPHWKSIKGKDYAQRMKDCMLSVQVVASEQLNHATRQKITNSEDLIGGCQPFYLPRLLICDQFSAIWSFCASGHNQVRGPLSFGLMGMFFAQATLSLFDHFMGPHRSIAEGYAEIEVRRPARTRSIPCFHSSFDTWPQGDLRGILPIFYLSCCLHLHVDIHHRSLPRESHLMAKTFQPVKRSVPSPQVSSGHMHCPSSFTTVI